MSRRAPRRGLGQGYVRRRTVDVMNMNKAIWALSAVVAVGIGLLLPMPMVVHPHSRTFVPTGAAPPR